MKVSHVIPNTGQFVSVGDYVPQNTVNSKKIDEGLNLREGPLTSPHYVCPALSMFDTGNPEVIK